MVAFTVVGAVVGCLLLLAVVQFLGAWYAQNKMKTPPFLDDTGKPLADSVAVYRKIPVRDSKQAVLIRGLSRNNPVLLNVHGGPGAGVIGQYEKNRVLEDHFTVVYWDQYGASKSYRPFLRKDRFVVEEFLADGLEVVRYVKSVLPDSKIILHGHSWGSYLSVLLAHRHPELFAGVVNAGQVVNFYENEKASFEFAKKTAQAEGNEKAVKSLEGVDGYWNKEGRELITGTFIQRKWLIKLGGHLHGRRDAKLLMEEPFNDHFGLFDAVPWYLGSLKGAMTMIPVMIEHLKLDQQVPSLDIPYYLIHGKSDYATPWPLAEEYFNSLAAPHKELFCLEQSGHEPALEQPQEFNNIFIEKIRSQFV